MDCLTVNGMKLTDPKGIANEFGSYFANVGKNFAENIKKCKTAVNKYIDRIDRNKSSIFLYPTNPTELTKMINELPNKTSCGHDDISNCLLKKLGSCIVKPLCNIFNPSIQEGMFPKQMKVADVVPYISQKKSKSLTTTGQYPYY